ncbi:MAG: T9SS type A sorting domain-containing protein, partial [Chitinophagales bacterium]
RWVKRQPAIDSTRVYMYGNSHNGFGALLTAMNIPSEISSLYVTAPPLIYKPKSGDKRERQLGKTTVSLPTDINYPGTTNPIQIWDFCDMRDWSRINKQGGLPFIQAINGKNDTKAGWVQKNHWYDTVNAYRQGGKWYWDQRVHNGDNALFTTLETQTDYTRYFTNKSYPAFSFCTINQNPGTGDPANGDPYGAINGYLDWDNNSINDLNCSYSINCFIKTFYVGGVADAEQFDSCYTDITLRRTQNFHPLAGQTITWTNYDTGNNLLQSGNFVYDGKQITIAAVKIKKPGSTISLAISNCFNRQNEVVKAEEACSLIKTTDGYTVVMKARSDQHAVLDIFDIAGHSVRQAQHELHSGNNNIHLQLPSGLYLLKVSSDEIRFTGKMIF